VLLLKIWYHAALPELKHYWMNITRTLFHNNLHNDKLGTEVSTYSLSRAFENSLTSPWAALNFFYISTGHRDFLGAYKVY